jgi:hypothetical protein
MQEKKEAQPAKQNRKRVELAAASSSVALAPPPSPLEVLQDIVRDEGGVGALFQGADSSAVGYFVAGGVGFAMTEVVIRKFFGIV